MNAEKATNAPLRPLVITIAVVVAAIAIKGVPAVLGGDLVGSDDMMRMQQVRDLIAGQGWYDVDQARLLTPEGGAMHWSRLPDIFLAGIVLLLQPLIGREVAEMVAVVFWPLMLFTWALAATATCLRRIGAPLIGQMAGLAFFTGSFAVVNFMPGRIDHHGLGIALTLTALACLLSPQRTARSAALAATCVAAMITVAIENLPAALLTIAGFGAAWILRGAEETNRLRSFGAGLVIAALIAYVFDAPGAGGNRAVCDAYGQSHFVALLVAGAGQFAIATFMPAAEKMMLRAVSMLMAGAATMISFAVINPDCLGDPYSRLSGEVHTGWLSVVSEARSLPATFSVDPAMALFYYGFILAGLAAAVAACVIAPKGARFGRGALAVAIAAAFLVSVWQVRSTALAHGLAAISTGWLCGILFEAWRKARTSRAALTLFVVFLLASPMGWRLPKVLAGGDAENGQSTPEAADCRSRDTFTAIAAAPRMIVFTPIDLGPPLIYHTRHYASAAPYHRNPSSIEMTLSVFGGSVDTARRKIEMTGATHLLYCPGLGEVRNYAKRAPDGFAAALERGDLPNWLVPLTGREDGSGPVVYTIAYDRN